MTDQCGTPEPGETVEAMLERKQADGSITVGDADAVREFAEYLRNPGPICPDCAAGKCGICNGQAFDSANDLIVDCACPHGKD